MIPYQIILTGLIASTLFAYTYQLDDSGYEYYKPIVSNNLFRPLGWKQPDSSPKYELVATIISETYKKAYIRDVRYGRDYFVGIGDNVGGNAVLEINRGMVQLDGEEISGETFGLLDTSVNKRRKTQNGKVGSSTSSGTGNKSTGAKEGSAENTGLRQRTNRGRTGGVDWQAQVQRFQNASPEERQSMIEQFRQMRGSRGNRRSRRQRD